MTVERDTAISNWLLDVMGLPDVRVAGELGGGNANVTLLLESPNGRMVLRTPPPQAISSKSHRGIEREAQILRALGGRARVPAYVAWCDSPEVIGKPFLVAEHVAGVSITDTLPPAYPDTADSVNKLGTDLVAELANIHSLPWQSIGLEKFGRPEGFLRRQVERWSSIRRDDTVRELPELERLGNWLLEHEPEPATGRSALTHGDYHLDNTLSKLEAPGLAAVIDWELATIGDPLSDLGLLLMFWGNERRASPPGFAHIQRISQREGLHSRLELAQAWSAATGIALDNLDYYLCFAFWRLAAIVEGAYVLFRQGKVDSAYARGLEHDVPALLTEAAAAAEGDW